MEYFYQYTDQINAQKQLLETHHSTYSESLDATCKNHILTAVQLLAELLKHCAPPTQVRPGSGAGEDKVGEQEEEAEEPDETSPAVASLPLTLLYAMLCDLKAVVWKHVQSLNSQQQISSNAQVSGNTSIRSEEQIQQAHKRRRGPATLPSTPTPSAALSMADHKLLDALQQHHNYCEAGSAQERTEHFLHQVCRNEEAFEQYDWEQILDFTTYSGAVLLIS